MTTSVDIRSEGAVGTPIPRDDNSKPGVAVILLNQSNTTGGFDVRTEVCSETVHLQCEGEKCQI